MEFFAVFCGFDRVAALRPAAVIRPAVVDQILKDTGSWDAQGWICLQDLQKFRQRYLEELLVAEKGELTQIEMDVMQSLRDYEILTTNPDAEFEAKLTLGQRLADRIASFGGSWMFICFFGVVIFAWMVLNTVVLTTRPFDPYPFILLNLVLSTLAAIQAPIIMMSQNRQEDRDRSRATHDYQINLKAELEIRHLHQKIDHLISQQWERMVEIQEIQIELIDEMRARR